MNRIKPHLELGKPVKVKNLDSKLAKIKRHIQLEFEEEALSELDDLTRSLGHSIDVYPGFQIAEHYFQLRNYKSCIKVLDSLKEGESRKEPRIQNLKGLAQMKLGNLKTAIDLFEICLVINKKYKIAQNNLGNIYMQKKEYQKALKYYTMSKESKIFFI